MPAQASRQPDKFSSPRHEGGDRVRRHVLTEAAAADPELPALVVAPAIGVAVADERARVTDHEPAGHDQLKCAAASHGNGHGSVRCRTVAELAPVVKAPAVRSTSARERTRVLHPRVDACKSERGRDRHRGAPVVVELSPSWPLTLLPQQYADPITREAAGMSTAAGKLREGETTSTATGTMLHGEAPPSVAHIVVGTGMPSCPLSPRPQQYAASLVVSAQV